MSSPSGAGTRIVNGGSDTRYYEEPVRISMRHRNRKEPIVIEGEIVSPTEMVDTRATRHGHRTATTRRRRRRGDRPRYYSRDYQQNPSVLHGMWNKFLGTLTGNARRKRHGEREIRHAKRIREALRIAKRLEAQDAAADGHYGHGYGGNKLRKSQRRMTYGNGRHHHQDPIFVSANPVFGSGGPPWMHHYGRTPSPMQGFHQVVLGWLTGNKQRRRIGKAMMMAAEEDRRRERERRKDEMRDMGRRNGRDKIWTF